MTTFVTGVRAVGASRPVASPAASHGLLRQWIAAFRGAARAELPTGMDPVALRMFGRD